MNKFTVTTERSYKEVLGNLTKDLYEKVQKKKRNWVAHPEVLMLESFAEAYDRSRQLAEDVVAALSNRYPEQEVFLQMANYGVETSVLNKNGLYYVTLSFDRKKGLKGVK